MTIEVQYANETTPSEKDYLALTTTVENGFDSSCRTGDDTVKIHGGTLRFPLADGVVPVLTTKKVSHRAVAMELQWFLNGSTDNKALKSIGTTIWDEWAAPNGSLGPIYGAMWRRRPASYGATKRTISVEKLKSRYKETKDVVYLEKDEIMEIAELNSDYKVHGHDKDELWQGWLNVISICASRFIMAMTEGNIDVDSAVSEDREECKKWVVDLQENTLFGEITVNMFGAINPSKLYKPWFSFENFKADVGRIAYNEVPGARKCQITSYFHGVRFYAPWSTCFLTSRLREVFQTFVSSNSQEFANDNRPIVFIDQIKDLIDTLKTNPDSRRMVVSSWDPTYLPDESMAPSENPALGLQALAPCHHDWQVLTRKITLEELYKEVLNHDIENSVNEVFSTGNYEAQFDYLLERANEYRAKAGRRKLFKYFLSLRFTMRSTDLFLGAPFNITSYAMLAHWLADVVDMNTEDLIYQGGDIHLYMNTITHVRTQRERQGYDYPTIEFLQKMEDPDQFSADQIMVLDYKSHGALRAKVSV